VLLRAYFLIGQGVAGFRPDFISHHPCLSYISMEKAALHASRKLLVAGQQLSTLVLTTG
jgi:hypothetical protein